MKIIAIVGPTGVGKTSLSISLAKKYNAEIISCDAMQVYKDLNIGTAKVTKEEMDNVVHHMIDIVNVEDNYTVYDYQKDGRKILHDIMSREKNIIIVGGTGLYLKALLYNYNLSTEEHIDLSDKTNEELINFIKENKKDLEIDFNNRRRLERAYTKIVNNSSFEKNDMLLYDILFIGLTTSRDILYDRINKRVDKMIEDGLIEEVRSFYNKNIRTKSIMTGIGYKELYDYFDGNISLDEAIELIKKRSRNYAKRQYTFFNHQLPVTWFDVDFNNFNNTINDIINYIDNENNIDSFINNINTSNKTYSSIESAINDIFKDKDVDKEHIEELIYNSFKGE